MAALPEGIEAIAVCRVPFDSTDEVELSLTPGDKVLITRLEVGGGWLEGMLQGGLCRSSTVVQATRALTHFTLIAHVAPVMHCDRHTRIVHYWTEVARFIMLQHQRRPISVASK